MSRQAHPRSGAAVQEADEGGEDMTELQRLRGQVAAMRRATDDLLRATLTIGVDEVGECDADRNYSAALRNLRRMLGDNKAGEPEAAGQIVLLCVCARQRAREAAGF